MVLSRGNSSKSSTIQRKPTPEETEKELEELKFQLETLTRTLDNLKEGQKNKCSTEILKDPLSKPGGSAEDQNTPPARTPQESKAKISLGSSSVVVTQSVLKYIKQLQDLDKLKLKREKKFHKKCLNLNKKLLEFEIEASNKDRLNAELDKDIQHAKLNIEERLRKIKIGRKTSQYPQYYFHKTITPETCNDHSSASLGSSRLSNFYNVGTSKCKKKTFWERLKKFVHKKPKDCPCLKKCSNSCFYQGLYGRCQCNPALEEQIRSPLQSTPPEKM